MPLEDEEVPKKEEGGEELNPEQIKGIVKQVLAEKQEKGQLSEEIGELRKGIKNANEELVELRKLFCTPDGKRCFATQTDLDAYMQKQDTRAKELDGKVGEIATQIKQLKPAPSTTPEGLQRLPKMTAEFRKGMNEEDNRARDREAAKIGDYYEVTNNDRWRILRKDGASLDVISGKPEMVSRVLKAIPSMPQDQKGKITQVVCTDRECRVELEKGQGARIYKQDGKGRWKWLDEPEKEGPHI